MIMRIFFEYCFYRAAKFYKSWGENNNYYISGKFSLFLALCANLLTLIGLFYFIFGTKYSINIVYLVWILLSVLSFFILNRKKYAELEQRYKEERNSKLKGWLVFLYIIGSIILFFVSLYLYGYWIGVKI